MVKRGILMQKNAGGGSTITQQLAKQFYSPTADNVMERLLQKPIEWVIAVQLERYYTKEEILTMYLNKFDFLNNAVGIKTAANTYFSKEPKDLKTEEAATLVGMCKNPSLYNPKRFNERSRGRRNVVLDQMRKTGYLSDAEADSLKKLPLVLKYRRVDHKEGLATYFREYLRLHNGSYHFYQWFHRKYHTALRDRIYVAGKMKTCQIIQKVFGKTAKSPEIVNIIIIKMQTFDVINDLIQAGTDSVAAVVRILAVKQIKYHSLIGVIFKISLHHSKLIQVCQ